LLPQLLALLVKLRELADGVCIALGLHGVVADILFQIPR
jgi:hypothetical protein